MRSAISSLPDVRGPSRSCKNMASMRDLERWQFNEFQQVGRDYSDSAEVEIYDSTHADFRDVEAESNQVLDLLGVGSSDVSH